MTTMRPRVAAALSEAARRHADAAGPITGPADFAAALGYPVSRIAKTLVVAAPVRRGYAAVVFAADRRLDPRVAGAVLNCPRVEIASADALATLTGYPRTGVSPLGLPCAWVRRRGDFVRSLRGRAVPLPPGVGDRDGIACWIPRGVT